jgi:CRISPR system Cascade subunit CasE
MLHLSLIQLPKASLNWRQVDPYEAHQVIWKAFPGVERGSRPFLFNLNDRVSHHSLLVQSQEVPDWGFLDSSASVQHKSFDPNGIVSGTHLHYYLRANPTADRRGFSDGKTRRVAVGSNRAHLADQMGVSEADVPSREELLIEWMARKGEVFGFALQKCQPGPTVARRIIRHSDMRLRKPAMTIHEVEFTGLLQVEHPDQFARACTYGLGRARAFGYGLLMIRSV